MNRSFAVAGLMLALCMCIWGCPSSSEPPGTPCNVDGDCPADQFCGAGGCQLECYIDLDCVPMAPRTRCGLRGRCVAPADAGPAVDASYTSPCPVACDDEVFCNGVGFCIPDDPAADPDGCVRYAACPPDECSEAARSCDPCVDPDDDDDGFDDARCGGLDCDDFDPDVNPRGEEVCDPGAVDEDCSPRTLGADYEDEDRDSYWPRASARTGHPCCNGEQCGGDCADVGPFAVSRFPDARETCNRLDDDCNGRVDEGVAETFYRDDDCDGHGVAIPVPTPLPDGTLPSTVAEYVQLGCNDLGMTTCVRGSTPGWVRSNDDCNDGDAGIRPGVAEVCDVSRVDEDCNHSANEGCDCTGSGSQPCDGVPFGGTEAMRTNTGLCRIGTQTCDSGRWSACVGGANGVDETCDDRTDENSDQDCDGRFDEGLLNACGDCGATPAELCNGADDDCDGLRDDGFACVLGTPTSCTACGWGPFAQMGSTTCVLPGCTQSGCTPPSGPEPATCDGVDNNCDSRLGDPVRCFRRIYRFDANDGSNSLPSTNLTEVGTGWTLSASSFCAPETSWGLSLLRCYNDTSGRHDLVAGYACPAGYVQDGAPLGVAVFEGMFPEDAPMPLRRLESTTGPIGTRRRVTTVDPDASTILRMGGWREVPVYHRADGTPESLPLYVFPCR